MLSQNEIMTENVIEIANWYSGKKLNDGAGAMQSLSELASKWNSDELALLRSGPIYNP